MGINISSNFTLGTGIPLDSRTIVADLTARDAISSDVRYEGLLVYVVSEETNYQLVNGVTNADWELLSSPTAVKYTGTPVDDQVAVWTAIDTIEGTSALTFSATGLVVASSDSKVSVDAITPYTGGGNVRINSLLVNSNNLLMFSTKTGTSDVSILANNGNVTYPTGDAIILRAGSGYSTGNTNGGSMFFQVGLKNGSGLDGNYYFGNGSSVGYLPAKASETNVVHYDTLTGKISYGTVANPANMVDVTGTPANNQIAVWTDSNTIEGVSNLTWTGQSLTVTSAANMIHNMKLGAADSFGVLRWTDSLNNSRFSFLFNDDTDDLRLETTGIETSTPPLYIGALGNVCIKGTVNSSTVELTVSGDTDITGTLKTNIINEYTLYSGVTIEGVKLTTNYIAFPTVTDIKNGASSSLYTHTSSNITKLNNGSTATGAHIILIGNGAGLDLATGTNSIFIGLEAGRYATAGSNIFIGDTTGSGVSTQSTGTENIFLGQGAGYGYTTGSQNVAIGPNSLRIVTTGSRNIVIGDSAGRYITTTSDNVILGRYASLYNTGSKNIILGTEAAMGESGNSTTSNSLIIGYQSGNTVTTGSNNTLLGYMTGRTITTASNNIAIGLAAMEGNSHSITGGSNIAIGVLAGQYAYTGVSNIYIGTSSGQGGLAAGITGSYNTAIGESTLAAISSGTENTAIGYFAGSATTTGLYNVAIGFRSGSNNSTGSNSFIGHQSGQYATGNSNTFLGKDSGQGNSGGTSSGTYNVFLGSSTGSLYTTGSYNILIGNAAGAALTTGSSNILIGASVDIPAAGDSYKFRLGTGTTYLFEGDMDDTPVWVGTDQVFKTDIIQEFTSSAGVRIGSSSNNTTIESDGTLTFNGTATVFDDLRVEPQARTIGANAPTFEKWLDDSAGTSRGVYLYSFDDAVGGSEKETFFTMQFPHAWAGTDISVHVHWIGAVDDTTSAPRWGLEYAWKDIGEVFGDTTIVYSSGVNVTGGTPDTDITAFKHYISEFADITPGATQNGISSILIGRLFRDSANAADTYNATGAKCGLLYVDAHYEINTIGSRSEYTK